MKKLFALILALVMALALTACGNDSTTANGNTDFTINHSTGDTTENTLGTIEDITSFITEPPATTVPATEPVHTEQVPNSQMVYITETGKKYHSTKHCPGLSNAKEIFETTLQEALSKNLGSCARCH